MTNVDFDLMTSEGIVAVRLTVHESYWFFDTSNPHEPFKAGYCQQVSNTGQGC